MRVSYLRNPHYPYSFIFPFSAGPCQRHGFEKPDKDAIFVSILIVVTLLLNLIVALIMFLFAAYICIVAVAMPVGLAATFWVGAGAFPFLMGALLALLALWWIIDTLKAMKKEKLANSEKKPFLEEVFGTKKERLHLIIISAAILIYVFVLIPLFGEITRQYGFVIASFVFLTATIKAFNEISLPKALIISAATSILIFVVFHYGLSVVMPT